LFATQVAQKKNLEKIPKKESEEKIHPACLFTKAAHIPPPPLVHSGKLGLDLF